MAHFAVITFGLVALLGAWRDPLHDLHLVFGLSALLALICIGLACWPKRYLTFALQQWDTPFVGCLREMRRAWALRELLEFIRRAHLSCGAPPRPAMHDSFSKGEGSIHHVVNRALAPFHFSSTFTFRR